MKAIQYTVPLKASTSLKLALFSDIHFDSPDCDKETLKKHLDYCKQNNIYILIGGDLYDAILLKDQKRAVNHLMEQTDNQLNVKIQQVIDFLKPYQNLILFIGRGNHEESIMKYNGLDIIQLTTQLLNQNQQHQIQIGNYANFLRFNFNDKNNKSRLHYDIFQNHGAGGNSPVTKGMIDFDRILKGVNADLVWNGHKHNSIMNTSDPIMYIDQNGEVKLKNRQAIQTPSYQKGRTIDDHNINFAERFYTHQALPGFGLIELTPSYEGNVLKLITDIKLINNPVMTLGQIKDVKLKTARVLRQKQK